ncbi:MAG: dihydropteroate synthase [SAR86 cluster bacterium]|uniref:Dihydropteroate synthase n=1 Tax=SAR86 cluster bacterium TaxID=2030880 RepID=A0A2A5CHJ0_9GAMM|nr:MAG: dihydropteroate synthase [SAR86 cluster bacterium]
MNFAGKIVDLETPKVMGVLNVTPDSFSDGGELLLDSGKLSIDKALQRAEVMYEAGATFIDIGGESTKPGALDISLEEEMARVLPLVEKIRNNIDIIVSIDTSSPELMLEGAKSGAGLINDVRALQRPGAVEAVSKTKLPVCLMHMQGTPATMQEAPSYAHLIDEILQFLEDRISACINSGVDRNQIIIDPGFGFGKTLEHNLDLLGRLHELKALKFPLLIGLSRKAMLGLITGKRVKQRQAAGISAAVIGLMQGVNIIRTHDVAETVDAIKVYLAVKNNELKLDLSN